MLLTPYYCKDFRAHDSIEEFVPKLPRQDNHPDPTWKVCVDKKGE